ncbi:MAG TPA: MogA/MoaB family molybdenum cofactor biosynthesis protein [Thermomicrobiales bacterium]|nr:MogA/MoaB family molybdenum cofactor biosynthesis protein [Thermomicrobiales bacterium]
MLTVSDTRSVETDTSGALVRQLLNDAGHPVIHYEIVPDEPDRIRATVEEWIADERVQAVLANGGTGIADRDTSYEAIVGLLDKRLDGFGELFRMLSYQEIGAAAMLSRAVAGAAGQTVVVAMPGSRNAVRLAMERLILPELGHLVFEITK